MNWLNKIALTDTERITKNILRLEALQEFLHKLAFFVVASNSGGYQSLKTVLEDNLVRGRPKVYNKLKSALMGENNSKIALDSPGNFQKIVFEAEELTKAEIGLEKRKLRELKSGKD